MLNENELKIITELHDELQPFVVARFQPPIYRQSPAKIELDCYNFIKDATDSMDGHVKRDNKEVALNLAALLSKDLKRAEYRTTTLEEIGEAIYRGCRREYGDFFAVNLSTIHGWIKSYLKSEKRHKALNEFTLLLKDRVAVVEVPEDVKKEKNREAYLKAFKHFKETKGFTIPPHFLYDALKEIKGVEIEGRKTLVPDVIIRSELMEKAKEGFTKYQKEVSRNAIRRGDYSIEDAIKKGLSGNNKESFALWYKREYLTWYFNSIETLEI